MFVCLLYWLFVFIGDYIYLDGENRDMQKEVQMEKPLEFVSKEKVLQRQWFEIVS